MSEKNECVPPRRLLQASLPFDGGDDAFVAATGPGEDVVPAPAPADQAVVPCLEPGDPDAYLNGLSNEELRRCIDDLGASSDRRAGAVLRRLKAIVLLRQRGGLACPRWARLTAVAPSPVKSRDGIGPRKLRCRTVIDNVIKAKGALAAERFAEWLAEDLYDASSIGDFREIARALRIGVLTRELVSKAYRVSRRPGIRNRSACFRKFLWQHWPGAVAQARVRRR